MIAAAETRRPLPLIAGLLGLTCFLWLAWHGGRGWWISQLHGDMGGGLLNVIVLGMAAWAAVGAAANLWVWRRSKGMPRRRLIALVASVTLIGFGPPLIASAWILDLLLWKARYG